VLVGSLLVGSLILSSGATAKEFKPGDLSVCGASRCASIRSQSVLDALTSFYYNSAQPPVRARAPRLAVPFYRIEFSNGYISGIVAGAGSDRFLSYGVNLDQFHQRLWYRVPPRALAGLRRLIVGLTPLRLTVAVLTDAGTFAAPPRSARQTSPPRSHSTTSGRHGNSMPWPLVLVALASLIALLMLGRRRQRAEATHLSIPSLR
jgi:hypothetical protein